MPTVSVKPPKTPVTKGSNGIAAATLPNICKMPPPPPPFCPTPLPNIGRSGKNPKGYSTTVKFEKNFVAITGSSFDSIGDIASKATGGGIISSNCEGPTKFISPGELTVKVQNKFVQYLGDLMLNNCGPAGAPANSATLAGEVQLFGATRADFFKLAEACNKEINRKLGYCPGPGPSGEQCTTAGTAKHKCCEDAANEYNKKNPDSPLRPEVPFDRNLKPMPPGADSAARAAANAEYNAAKAAGKPTKGVWAATYFGKGGPVFKADLLVEGPGGYKAAYDYKFSCKPAGTKGLMSKRQKRRYRAFTRCKAQIIHVDGRQC